MQDEPSVILNGKGQSTKGDFSSFSFCIFSNYSHEHVLFL